MKNILNFTIVLAILFGFSLSVCAQETQDSLLHQRVTLKMVDGKEIDGTFFSQNEESIILTTRYGKTIIDRKKVLSLQVSSYKGLYDFKNPHSSYYFFGPSGFQIRKGEGYYQNSYVGFNFLNYGVTDNFSIGGGLEMFSTLSGHPVWFLTPKLGFKLQDKVHFGTGIFMFGFEDEFVTLGFSALTFGTEENNFSLGVGSILDNDQFGENPALSLSGLTRVKEGLALMTENYFVFGENGDIEMFGLHGIRIIGKKNSFDFGILVIPSIFDDIKGIPYAGYVRKF